MKLLHTADWHLGRTLYNVSRAPDHRAVLDEICEIAESEGPDLVIHAGDLFDRERPPYDAIRLALDTLERLGRVAPVVVIRGNHDHAALFAIFRRLAGDHGRVTWVDRPRRPDDGGVLQLAVAGGERVRLACLPFVHANRVVDAFEDPASWHADYAERVERIERALGAALLAGADPERDVLLYAAHLHVTGARFSGSERRLHVTDTYATRAEHLPAVSYAAFGHIHRPQELPGPGRGRYAGSPLQLDFGEEGEAKEVVIVEAAPGEPAAVRPVRLERGRRLRRVAATLDDLERALGDVGDALLRVTVETEEPQPDLSDRVADLAPQATLLEVREVHRHERLEVVEEGDEEAEEAPLPELFAEYLGEQGSGGVTAERVLELFRTFWAAAEDEEEPRLDRLESFPGPLTPPGGEPASEAEPEPDREPEPEPGRGGSDHPVAEAGAAGSDG